MHSHIATHPTDVADTPCEEALGLLIACWTPPSTKWTAVVEEDYRRNLLSQAAYS